MKQDNLRKFYREVGKNLKDVRSVDYFQILSFACLSAFAYIMTNYWAYKGQYASSLGSGIGAISSGIRSGLIYRKAVKNIEKN